MSPQPPVCLINAINIMIMNKPNHNHIGLNSNRAMQQTGDGTEVTLLTCPFCDSRVRAAVVNSASLPLSMALSEGGPWKS